MFIDNDEFGINDFKEQYKKNFDKFAKEYKVEFKQQEETDQYVQGDMLGIRTNTFEPTYKWCLISITSTSKNQKRQEREGFSEDDSEYKCISLVEYGINHNDVVIIGDNRYRVVFDTYGNRKMENIFVKFTLKKDD